MQNTPLTIDLNKNWSLYDISGTSGGLGMDETNAKSAIILPSATLETGVAKAHLRDPNKKKALHAAIQKDQPIPHFLGMLHFEKNIQQVVQHIELKTATAKVDEYDEAEQLVLTIQDEQASALKEVNLRLNIFDNGLTDGLSVSEGITEVEAEVLFLDENGKQLHKQVLTADTTSNLQNSIAFNLGDTITEGSTEGKKGKKIIDKGKKIVEKVKKIIVIIKKLFKKIKTIVSAIKDKSVQAIIQALRPVKEKLTGSPYKILGYDFAAQAFTEIPPSEVAADKKTLILLHGTVKGSFDGRIGRKNKRKGEGSFKYLHNYQVEERSVKYKHWFDFLHQKSESNNRQCPRCQR